MRSEDHMPQQLSRQLGNLFYAIAKADSSLAFEEYQELSNILENQWTGYSADSVDLIKTHFNTVQKQNRSPESCFKYFTTYVSANPEVFSSELKALILKTANEIAYAYSKINKSELNYMARLSIAFKNAGL